MIPAAAAAQISKQSLRAICRKVEANQIHYYEAADGLFICLSSLPEK